MAWFDANDYLVLDVAARNRVRELRAAIDDDPARRPRCLASRPRALIVGLIALAAGLGCATGPRGPAVDASDKGTAAGLASPTVPPDEIPRCDGTYNRAAGLCASEGP